MSGGWDSDWDPEPWTDDPSPVRDSWATVYEPSDDGTAPPNWSTGAARPVVVLAAGGGALAATALGLVVLLLGGAVVALIVGATVLLGACALGSAYLRGAR